VHIEKPDRAITMPRTVKGEDKADSDKDMGTKSTKINWMGVAPKRKTRQTVTRIWVSIG